MNAAVYAEAAGLLLLAMPLVFLLVSAPSAAPGAASARRYRRRVFGASVLVFGLALIANLAYALGATDSLLLPLASIGSVPVGLSVQVNGMTLLLATLVSFVLMIIARYSVQYLDGEREQARFFRLLALTGGGFLLVVIAGNLAQFTLAITATGFSLHRLLAFYADRPRAVMVMHKKSIFSRTADALLLIATLLIGHQVGSLEFSTINAYAENTPHLPFATTLAAWLIVLAAVLKSAHFPFHGWLIQVMEAPTPVSALMHAGVVYSGAIIVLRTSGLLAAEGYALLLLGLIGLLTLIIASLVMLTQTAIKSSLAWSTVAQLGFMSLELGLGLFALALLHLVGHSLYKAHAFLSSGGMADLLRQPQLQVRRSVTVGMWLLVIAGSLSSTVLMAMTLGLSFSKEPTLIAVTLIIALAVAQLILKVLGFGHSRDLVLASATALGMAALYFALHEGFAALFGHELAPFPSSLTPLQWGLIGLTLLGFLWMAWLQGPGRAAMRHTNQTALFIHLYNGLYVDRWVERFAYRIWPEKVGRENRMPAYPTASPNNHRESN